MKNTLLRASALALGLFALLTLFMSSSVIFDLFGIRAKEGNYVLFIVLSNFVCGFIYLLAAYGLFTEKPWTTRLLIAAVGILVLSFLGLMWHVNSGGLYEIKTVKAMLFRISFTSLFTGISWHFLSRNRKQIETTFNSKKSILL